MVLACILANKSYIKEIGKMGQEMVMAIISTKLQRITILVLLEIIWNKERGELFMVMEVHTLVIFTMIYPTVKGFSSILIRISIMVVLEKEKNKEKETIILVKEQFLVGLGKMMKKFKDNWLYLMEIFFKVLFNRI